MLFTKSISSFSGAESFGPKSYPLARLYLCPSWSPLSVFWDIFFVSLPFRCTKLQQKNSDDGPDPSSTNKTGIFGSLWSWSFVPVWKMWSDLNMTARLFISHSHSYHIQIFCVWTALQSSGAWLKQPALSLGGTSDVTSAHFKVTEPILGI